jgi:hypothetical protein
MLGELMASNHPNRKSVTKSDIVRALKEHDNAMEMMYRHILLIDDVFAKYIDMKKDGDALAKFMNATPKEDGKPKQPKRKRRRRSTSASKK